MPKQVSRSQFLERLTAAVADVKKTQGSKPAETNLLALARETTHGEQ